MSEEEFAVYDKLLEDDSEDEKDSDKKTKPIKANANSTGLTSKDLNPKLGGLGPQDTGIHATRGNYSKNPVSVIKSSDLMDGVISQSPVFSDYINKQISMRMTKDLEKMSDKLNIGIKNKLLSESNDNDYDIVIDDNLFEEGDND